MHNNLIRSLVGNTTGRALLFGLSILLSALTHAQTFEDPVTILENSVIVDWFSDVEVNPADATVDMIYTSWDGEKYHVHYAKLFTDGSIWRTTDLGSFITPSEWPPIGSVTEYNGRVFVISVTDEGEASFFASSDGGETFTSYPPEVFIRRADILANEYGCHLMFVNEDFELVYAQFDPVQHTWTFFSPAISSGVLAMRPSLAEGDNKLFVVYQASDTLHYERSALSNGNNWSSERQIPNSKFIEHAMGAYPQLGPRAATTNAKITAGWAGSPPGGLNGPDMGASRRTFSDPSWSSTPSLSSTNTTYFGFAGNSAGLHYVYWNGPIWEGSLLHYRNWKDGNSEPAKETNLIRIADGWPSPRVTECVAHELGAFIFYGDFYINEQRKIMMIREQFTRPAPPAGLYVVASTSGGDHLVCQDDQTAITNVTSENDDHLPQNCPVDDSQNLAIEPAASSEPYHPFLRWYRNNFEYQVAQYIIWRRVVPSEDENWYPIDSVNAPATEYLDETMIFDPIGGFFAQYRIVAKSEGGTYSDYSNMASIRASSAMGKIAASASTTTESVPKEFALRQNYPNPFNPTTTIEFQLPAQGQSASTVYQTSLKLYNIHGQLVRTIGNGLHGAGSYRFVVDAGSLASGVYFYQLHAVSAGATYSARNKMILLK